MLTAFIVSLLISPAAAPDAQSLAAARKQFDAGAYQQAVEAASTGPDDPRLIYLTALSQQRLRHTDDARHAYDLLAARPDEDPWKAIGQSGLAMLASNTGEAVRTAEHAVGIGGSLAEAHYQRGLALAAAQNMGDAAAEFDKASEIDPTWAYAHYYAGIAYSKIKRSDLTASHFQTFLKLAPQAPERGEVQAILKTLGK